MRWVDSGHNNETGGRRFGCTRGHGVDVPGLGGGRIGDDDCAHGGIRVGPTIDS